MLMITLAFLYYLLLDRKVLQLLKQPLIQALFIGCLLACCVLWQLQATLPGLPPVHFLGITATVLILGLRLTLLLVPLALLLPIWAAMFLNHSAWPADHAWLWPWCATAVCAVQSYLVYLWVERYLSQHMFVRIFICGFFNAMLSGALFMSALALLHSWQDSHVSASQLTDYLLTIPLLAMPEALLNGMALTLLLVYRPHWLAAFRPPEC